jgi:hypothetical protein
MGPEACLHVPVGVEEFEVEFLGVGDYFQEEAG